MFRFFILSLAIATLCAAQDPQPDGLAQFRAGNLALTLSPATGALISAKDLSTNIELIDSPDQKLGGGWRLTVALPDGPHVTTDVSRAQHFRWSRTGDTLNLRWNGLALSDGAVLSDAAAAVDITGYPADSASYWQCSFSGLNKYQLITADCLDLQPIAVTEETRSSQRLFSPAGTGHLYTGALPTDSPIYPVRAAMQFIAIYGRAAGFYFAATDTTGQVKAFSSKATELAISHVFRPRPTGGGAVPYAIELAVFHGNWQTAAGIYRDWTATAPWVRDALPFERPGYLSLAMPREMSLVTDTIRPGSRSKQSLDELQAGVRAETKETGLTVNASLLDWSRFRGPSLDGNNAPEMGWADLRSTLRGIPVSADLNIWCLETTAKTWRDGSARANAVMGQFGQPKTYPLDSGECAAMQIGTSFWRRAFRELTNTLGGHGIGFNSFDLWPDLRLPADSDELAHEDIFDIRAFSDLLTPPPTPGPAQIRPPSGAVQAAEMLIPELQFMRTHSCNQGPRDETGNDVPAFDYVYRPLIVIDCQISGTASLAALARAVADGERIMIPETGTARDEDQRAFLRNASRARVGYASQFLVRGTMLPSATIESDGARSSVFTATWRSPTGDVGIALASTSSRIETLRVNIDLVRLGLRPGRDHTVRMLSAGGPVMVMAGLRNSDTATVSVSPFDVAVLVIHEESEPPGRINSITNSASADSQCGIAPGEIVDLAGDFGPPDRTQSVDTAKPGSFPLVLDDTRVFFGESRAAILLVSPTLIRVIVPWQLGTSRALRVRVTRSDHSSFISDPLRITAACPGFYNSATAGLALATNQDGKLNSDDDPALSGSTISIYGTGFGQVQSEPAAGEVFRAGAARRELMVLLDGQLANVDYAGLSGQRFTGVYEIRLKIPAGLSTGRTDVAIVLDGQHIQNLKIALK